MECPKCGQKAEVKDQEEFTAFGSDTWKRSVYLCNGCGFEFADTDNFNFLVADRK